MNCYYALSAEASEETKNAVADFAKAVGFSTKEGKIETKSMKWGDITQAQMNLEMAKVEIWVDQANFILKTQPRAKVILAFNYLEPARTCAEMLPHKMVFLTGMTPPGERKKQLELFQAANTDCRVLIATTAHIATGTELGDPTKRFSRYVFISPGNSKSDEAQLKGRFQTPAHITFVYADCAPEEADILEAMRKKQSVLKNSDETSTTSD